MASIAISVLASLEAKQGPLKRGDARTDRQRVARCEMERWQQAGVAGARPATGAGLPCVACCPGYASRCVTSESAVCVLKAQTPTRSTACE